MKMKKHLRARFAASCTALPFHVGNGDSSAVVGSGYRMKKVVAPIAWRSIATLALIAAPLAHACSPVQVIGVYFDRNSSTVSAYQVSRLAQWMADLHLKYANFESIYIGTGAEPDEHAPDRLGMARARNVARVLRENLRFDESKLFLPNRSNVQEPVSDYLKTLDKSQGVRGVQLDFVPGCPHECPCQMNDPLYKPGASK